MSETKGQFPDLAAPERDAFLAALKTRFEQHKDRHPGMEWAPVRARLESSPAKLRSLYAMERSGGEPDVVDYDAAAGEYRFVDCSPESPAGRRNLCYDRKALDERKTFKPANSAMDMAAEMGIEMLAEDEYRKLQTLGEFDVKTSSWVRTPPDVRRLGGALFCDRRYGKVFVYHNGASSYYAVRGFRGSLKV